MAKEREFSFTDDDIDVEGAQASAGTGTYVEPGAYIVDLDLCKRGVSRKGKKYFLVELDILASTNPDRPPGSRMTWQVNIPELVDGKYENPALGNVKKFVATVMKSDIQEVTGKVLDLVTSPAQPLRGKRMRISATNIELKNGNDFTAVEWFIPQKGDQEKIEGLAKSSRVVETEDQLEA